MRRVCSDMDGCMASLYICLCYELLASLSFFIINHLNHQLLASFSVSALRPQPTLVDDFIISSGYSSV